MRHDKTFLFADYQGTITHSGSPMVTTVPLSARSVWATSPDFVPSNGNFPIPIYDPSSASLVRTQFPNNAIPLTRLDPAASALTALLPEPNQFDSAGQPLPFNNYAVTRTAISGIHSFDIRLDHQFNPQTTLYLVRHSFQNTDAAIAISFRASFGRTSHRRGTDHSGAQPENAGIGETHQFTPKP